jgi:head-tail adaptor
MADWMRTTVESTLGPAKATRQDRIETRTPTGGVTFTWVGGGFSYCNIASMSQEDLDIAGRMGAHGTVACRVMAAFDVDKSDRIVVSDSGADELDGTWEVTAVLTGYPHVDRLLYLGRLSDA